MGGVCGDLHGRLFSGVMGLLYIAVNVEDCFAVCVIDEECGGFVDLVLKIKPLIGDWENEKLQSCYVFV